MKYIFLSYINRSGSTFLANNLSRFNHICVCPEGDILYDLLLKNPHQKINKTFQTNLFSRLNKDLKLQRWKISLNEPERVFDNSTDIFLYLLNSFKEKHYPEATCILFKHNYIYRLAKHISTKTCCIYWINLFRDPRASYFSQKITTSPHTKKAMADNIISFADSWNTYYSGTRSFENRTDSVEITYEALITNRDNAMKEIILNTGCGIMYKPPVREEGELTGWLDETYKKIHPFINNPPMDQNIAKWKGNLTLTELNILSGSIKENKFYHLPLISSLSIKEKLLTIYLKLKGKYTYYKKTLRK